MNTIVALATPFGRSGIAVIRLSGENAFEIAQKLTKDEKFNPKPRFAYLKEIFDTNSQEFIDEVLLTYFKQPYSFTGEDVVEISCHGAPVIIRQLLDACLKFDARMAEPGEFSLRALSNGKINLSQAEAVRDLINARTIAAAQQASRQLRGELSNRLQPLKDELLSVIVILESALEFVEDDLPDIQAGIVQRRLASISAKISEMASTFQAGRLLREGLKVALVGRPNVGKSSIFNCLVGYDRAIVTAVAGTTRDILQEGLSIGGIPVTLIDTAGIRETNDEIENIGVKRTKGVLNDADLVVVVLGQSQGLSDEDYKILSEVRELNHLVAINKVDLNGIKTILDDRLEISNCVMTSAKTGEGLDTLRSNILAPFQNQNENANGFLISDARHFDLLLRANSEIEDSVQLIEQHASEEIVLIGLHNALGLLGQISGETSTEDLLTRIFSTFCIGK